MIYSTNYHYLLYLLIYLIDICKLHEVCLIFIYSWNYCNELFNRVYMCVRMCVYVCANVCVYGHVYVYICIWVIIIIHLEIRIARYNVH